MKYHNKQFIYMKPLNLKYILFFYMLIFSIFFYIIFTHYSYNKLKIQGIMNSNHIIVPAIINNSIIISKSDKVLLDNKFYKYNIVKFSEIYSNDNLSIQDITIDLKDKIEFKENKIVDLVFYYDKDLIIKKIMKGVFK